MGKIRRSAPGAISRSNCAGPSSPNCNVSLRRIGILPRRRRSKGTLISRDRRSPAPHAAQVVLGGTGPCDRSDGRFALPRCSITPSRRVDLDRLFRSRRAVLSALRLAAARGVDVRLLGSRNSDHPYLAEIGRSYYEQLLRSGRPHLRIQSGPASCEVHADRRRLADGRLRELRQPLAAAELRVKRARALPARRRAL